MNKIYLRKEPPGSPKKYRATLPNGKVVRFGLRGYSDFTLHKDPQRMMRYIRRHGALIPKSMSNRVEGLTERLSKVNKSSKEDWSRQGVNTAGFWSRWFLWSHPNLTKAAQRASKAAGMPVVLVR